MMRIVPGFIQIKKHSGIKKFLEKIKLMITKDTKITVLDAYNAMIKTIEDYNKFLQSDDINGLLSAMSLTTFTDGGSADPAVWEDWQ